MVTISIHKNQGLTQALKTYAIDNNYDVTGITSEKWQKTIEQLEKIQKERETNNSSSIYTNTNNGNDWHNKMVVNEGSIDFSETEITSLFTAMGLEYKTTNKADAFNTWCNDIATNPSGNQDKFQVKSYQSKSPESYNADLKNISSQFIKRYDTNNDNKITYNEYLETELKDIDTDNLSEDDNQRLQDTAKNIFNKINVDNEGNSKDKLDLREVMNFFFTMDAANEEYKADGYIEKDEYTKLYNGLRMHPNEENEEDRSYGEAIKSLLTNNFNAFFRNFK